MQQAWRMRKTSWHGRRDWLRQHPAPLYERCVAMSVASLCFAVQVMSGMRGVAIQMTATAVATVPPLCQGREACRRQSKKCERENSSCDQHGCTLRERTIIAARIR